MIRQSLALALALSAAASAFGGDLDTIGVSLLRATDSSLVGTGVRVAQPEAGAPSWEVNPAAVGLASNLFTWSASNGTTNVFPNSLGLESSHADSVGYNFYGVAGGVAPGVSHVDSYEGDYFFNSLVSPGVSIAAGVINQSFIFDTNEQVTVDTAYDNYAARYGVVFCSAVGNGGPVCAPGTAYNSIGVGVYGASSSTGPTIDNGRSKPDIVAPGRFTSLSTPYVAGAAAVLLQAAARGDGGPDITAAGDLRTIKALLLNGAIKPSDWAHTASAPLDPRYGAGIAQVFESYEQMAAGSYAPIQTTTVAAGAPHPPGSNPTNVTSVVGWDFRALSNSAGQDVANHYYFAIATNQTLTATLVWNRHANQTNINDLDLFLYDAVTGTLVTCSTSRVDNVEQIYLPSLGPSRYDLQVLKRGASGRISSSETYALAFEFSSASLSISVAGNAATLSWPVFPASYALESAPSLNTPISWSAVTNPITVLNNSNHVTVNIDGAMTYFRLQR